MFTKRRPCVVQVAALLCGLAWLAAPANASLTITSGDSAKEDGARGPRVGRVIRVTSPITTGVVKRVAAEADAFIRQAKQSPKPLWPVLIFEIQPGQSSYGPADDLARQILKLSGATTVAFIPSGKGDQPAALSGHAVLVALACEQLALDGDAYFGRADASDASDNQPSPGRRAVYEEIAEKRGTFPKDLAAAFCDPALEIIQAETATKKRLFLSKEHLEELKKKEEVAAGRKWVEAGKTAWLRGRDLADMGLVKTEHLVGDRAALAGALRLRPEEMEEDAFSGKEVRAAIFPIDSEKNIRRAIDKIKDQIKKAGVNLVILDLNTAGGVPEESVKLAKFLAYELKPQRCRTVALVHDRAAGEVAMIALACDEIQLMPNATLGGEGQFGEGREKERREQIATYRTVIAEIAKEKKRSPSLAAAMIDRNVVVSRYVRDENGQVDYFDPDREPDPKVWQRKEAVTVPGAALALSPPRAIDFHMATGVVESEDELKGLYSIENDPPRVGPDWVDALVEALKHPGVQLFLLMIGFTAFYAEMHSPGHGVGGFVAMVCFLLFFWANVLDGSAGWLEILMFLGGIVLLLIEVFVLPGFGIVGVGGIIMMMVSIVMAMQTFKGIPHTHKDMLEMRDSLTVVTLAAIGALAGAALVRRLLPRARSMSDLILAPTGHADDAQLTGQPDALAGYEHLIGRTGVTITQLTPSGKARIDDQLVDVLSAGDVVPRGANVVVVETHGNRIIVRAT